MRQAALRRPRRAKFSKADHLARWRSSWNNVDVPGKLPWDRHSRTSGTAQATAGGRAFQGLEPSAWAAQLLRGLERGRGAGPRSPFVAPQIVTGAFVLGAAGAMLGALVAGALAEGDRLAREDEEGGEGVEPRVRWRTGGVLVHARWGVPTVHRHGTLALELYGERLAIRRTWGRPLWVHWRELESIRRVRRTLGGPITRLDRGVDRPRIDLDLDDAEHEAFGHWFKSRQEVERRRVEIVEARELDVGGGPRILALRRPADPPWWIVRGVPLAFDPRRELVLERYVSTRALSWVASVGRAVRVRRHRLDQATAARVRALPEVVALDDEVVEPELMRRLDEHDRVYR